MSKVKNQLSIGEKVIYEGDVATVIGYGKPFMDYPVVTLEFPATLARCGKNFLQLDTRSVIEKGLKKVAE